MSAGRARNVERRSDRQLERSIFRSVCPMKEQLAYLKAVIEGEPAIERWRDWFSRNEGVLSAHLSRGQFLRLKLGRIKAIPEVLTKFGVPFTTSSRYEWLGGIAGRCRECGGEIQSRGNYAWCPNGCFELHWH